MAQAVQQGIGYFEITEQQHDDLVAAAAADPGNVLLQGLVEAFDYQSQYVPKKWYGNSEMIDTEEEWQWVMEYTDGNAYTFRNSQQPGDWYHPE